MIYAILIFSLCALGHSFQLYLLTSFFSSGVLVLSLKTLESVKAFLIWKGTMTEENMLGMIFAIYKNNSENCIHPVRTGSRTVGIIAIQN